MSVSTAAEDIAVGISTVRRNGVIKMYYERVFTVKIMKQRDRALWQCISIDWFTTVLSGSGSMSE